MTEFDFLGIELDRKFISYRRSVQRETIYQFWNKRYYGDETKMLVACCFKLLSFFRHGIRYDINPAQFRILDDIIFQSVIANFCKHPYYQFSRQYR